MRLAEHGRLNAARDGSAGHDEPCHARGSGTLEHAAAVVVETVVGEIGADIDELPHSERIVTTAEECGNGVG